MLNLWGDLHCDNAVFSLLAFGLKLLSYGIIVSKLIATESKDYGMTSKTIFILNWAVRYWNLEFLPKLRWCQDLGSNIIRTRYRWLF
jgi:hypothetical protein